MWAQSQPPSAHRLKLARSWQAVDRCTSALGGILGVAWRQFRAVLDPERCRYATGSGSIKPIVSRAETVGAKQLHHGVAGEGHRTVQMINAALPLGFNLNSGRSSDPISGICD